jgi:hypothetical protein
MATPDNLALYYTIVEEAILQLGVDPVGCRGKQPGQWNLRKGSARIWLDLWHIQNEQRAYFQAMSPIMPLPTERSEPFFKELLQINDKLFGVAFAVYDEWAWLKSIREVEGMSVAEALAIIRRIGYYADEYDNQLMDKYNIKRRPAVAGQSTDDDGPEAPVHPSIPPHLH